MSGSPSVELVIELTENGCTARIHADRGMGGGPIAVSLSRGAPHQRDDALRWVHALRGGSGGTVYNQARLYGQALFEAVFHSDVRTIFERSLGGLAPRQRLRVALNLSKELAAIPWELLYEPNNQFLALSDRINLVRQIEWLDPVEEPPTVATPRVIVVTATPQGLPLDPSDELAGIRAALAQRIEAGQLLLDVVEGAGTWTQLQDQLRTETTIIHFLCHSASDPQTGVAALVFADASGDPEYIDAESLRQIVQRWRGQIRLAILHACRSALGPDDDPFQSVAFGLIQGGIPAVIATQFDLPVASAALMAHTLYQELVAGETVDQAVTAARIRLQPSISASLDWVIPVHLSRVPVGAPLVLSDVVLANVSLPGGIRISDYTDCFMPGAESDQDSNATTFVDIGALRIIAGSPAGPASVLVFGTPGSGKTTHRHALRHAVRSRALVIELSDFSEVIDAHAADLSVERAMIRLIGEAALGELAEELRRPQRASRFHADPALKEPIWALRQLLPIPAALPILDGYQPEHPARTLRRYRGYRLTRWLRLLHGVARQADFESLYVLVDGLDDDARAHGQTPVLLALLRPLLDNRALLIDSGIAWKFFLPAYLYEPLLAALPALQALQALDLDSYLDDRALQAILNQRVRSHPLPRFTQIASPIERFADLCMPDLSKTAELELVRAARRSPRRLMQIAHDVVEGHLRRGMDDTSPIARVTLDETIQRIEGRRSSDDDLAR